MGDLGRAGTALTEGGAVVGLALPGVGAAISTLGQLASVIDPSAPEPKYELPPEWRLPYELGPLWGVPPPASHHSRAWWDVTISGERMRLFASPAYLPPKRAEDWIGAGARDPLSAGFAALTQAVFLRWIGLGGLVGGGLDDSGLTAAQLVAARNAAAQLVGGLQTGQRPEGQVVAFLQGEAARRGGAERLIGHRLRTTLGVIAIEAAGEPLLRLNATATEDQLLRMLGQWERALELKGDAAPQWPDIDVRPWRLAWLDWWHDRAGPQVYGPGSGPNSRRAWIDGRAPGAAEAQEAHAEHLAQELARYADRRAAWDAQRQAMSDEADRLAYLAEVEARASELWHAVQAGTVDPQAALDSLDDSGAPPPVRELAPAPALNAPRVAVGLGALIAALLLF